MDGENRELELGLLKDLEELSCKGGEIERRVIDDEAEAAASIDFDLWIKENINQSRRRREDIINWGMRDFYPHMNEQEINKFHFYFLHFLWLYFIFTYKCLALV